MRTIGVPLSEVPLDVFRGVLTHCNTLELVRMSMVNKSLSKIANHESLWSSLWGGPLPEAGILQATTFKDAVKWRYNMLHRALVYDRVAQTKVNGFPMHIQAFTVTSTRLITAAGSTVCIWDRSTTEMCHKVVLPAVMHVQCLEVVDTILLCGTSAGVVVIMDICSGLVISQILAHDGQIQCIWANKHVVITGGTDWCVRVFTFGLFELLHELRGHHGPVSCLTCEGPALYSGSSDGTVRLWDYRSGILIDEFNASNFAVLQDGYSGVVRSIEVSQGVVCCGCDTRVVIWNASNHYNSTNSPLHKPIAKPSEHLDTHTYGSMPNNPVVTCIHARPVKHMKLLGKMLVTCAGDYSLRIWDVATGQCIRQLDNPAGSGVAFFRVADGDMLFSSLFNQSITCISFPSS